VPSAPRILFLPGPVLVGPTEERGPAWVVDGRLTFVRPGDADVLSLPGWVLPGLVDAHCHIGLVATGVATRDEAETQAVTDRDAGTLLVRDAGQPGDTRWIDDRDDLPVVIRAGRHIARSRRYIRGYAREIEPSELTAVVRAEARRGDGWVKLVGDWIDRDRGDLAPCWSAEALAAAVAAAHEEGARVTAHCFGEDCLPDLLAAGIDCVEHATGLTAATLEQAVAAGVAIVPTLVNTANFPGFAAAGEPRYPVYARHMRALYGRRYPTVATAHEAGVPVFCGTDAGGTVPHGLVAREVGELVAAGLSATSAVDAACWRARAWLGRPGLVEGASADLVVLPGDPRRDVAVVGHPSAVVLRGRVFGGESPRPTR
jgi:imidazolonepropionase-like amidohydrolase